MKAIILPYVVDQNEPSHPLRRLIDVPQDLVARQQLFEDLFVELGLGDADTAADCFVKYDSPHADIMFGDGECFLLLTWYCP